MMEDVGVLPEGTVTFLLTDVEGSTRLWSTDPETAGAAIRHTYSVIDDCVRAHGGVRPVEQGEGDSTVTVFSSAGAAMGAALDAQLAMAGEPWPEGGPIGVRMALHTGVAELRDEGNYMGAAVIRCARLRELASGGDVLVSNATAALVADDLPAGAVLVDGGEHELRDLTRRERVWRLSHPGLGPMRPLRTAGRSERTNLHMARSELVGRSRELSEISALSDEAALVTLTGSGGVGKTRLAREVAVRAVERFGAGSWWVDLASLDDPTRVAATAAASIGVPEEPGRPAADSLLDWLERRELLMVLDNCEHVVDAVAELAAGILERCAEVRLIATSREPLGVVGEVTWRTPSLAVPTAAATTAAAVAGFAAVELFVRRARAARPGFDLADRGAPVVAEICRRLDGLPLAIELAAARVRTMSLEHLRASLDHRFRTLTGGARTALPRQQTLNASVAWSYDHLSGQERSLFRRLSVFAGPFTAETAEAVCGDDEVPEDQVLGGLAALTDRSMVEVLDDGRYRLLETLRHFAQEQAVQAGEIDTWRDRHLIWCRSIAPAFRIGPGCGMARAREGLTLLPDFRQALTWALTTDADFGVLVIVVVDLLQLLSRHDDTRRLGQVLHDALVPSTPRWVSAMAGLGQAPFQAADPATMARQHEALAEAVDPIERARLLFAGGVAQAWQGLPAGERAVREAAELARSAASHDDEAEMTYYLATTAATVGRIRSARPLVDDLAHRLTVSDGPWTRLVAIARGWTEIYSSIPTAARLFQQAATLAPEVGEDPGGRAGVLVCALWGREASLAGEALGADCWETVEGAMAGFAGVARAVPAVLAGEVDEAADALRPTLEMWTMGNISYWARLLDGDLALRQGDRARAEAVAEHLGAAIEGANLPRVRAELCVLRIGLALLDDEVRVAHDLALRALAEGVDNDAAILIVDGLEAVAVTNLLLGRPDVAGRLVGAAADQRDRSGYRWRHAALDAEIPAIVGDDALRDAVAQGRRLSLEEAAAYATRARGPRGRAAHGWDALTPAEQEVTRLVGEGCTNQQIADRLFVSTATVKTHLVHTYDKLGVRSRAQLAAQAARRPKPCQP